MILDAVPGVAQAKLVWAAGKAWFLLALVLILLIAGFYVGKRWEVANTNDALRERDNALQSRDEWKGRATGLNTAVKAWEKRYKEDEEADKAARELAAKLLDDLQKRKDKADADAKAWQAKYQAALKSPDCAELVKETRCAAFLRY